MTADRRTRLAASPLYLVASFLAEDADRVLPRLVAAAAAGVGVVQLRVKHVPTAWRRALLARLAAELPPGTLRIVNDDLHAVLADDGTPLADGVHLGRDDAALLAPTGVPQGERVAGGLRVARARLGPDLLIGTSANTLEELAAAVDAGADHAGFGAVAPSTTKPDTRPADMNELRRCLAAFPQVPVFAIGGIGPENLDAVVRAGCRRAAIGSAILDAQDPGRAAAECLARLRA